MIARFLLVATLSAGAVPNLSAQALRAFTTARQLHGEPHLTADLRFSGARLQVVPGDSGLLYRARILYDPARFDPIGRYGPDATVQLGLAARNGGSPAGDQLAVVSISPAVELDLSVVLGAAPATLHLGGLRLTSVAVASGASPTIVGFDRPNPVRCRQAAFTAGAAQLTITGLGNSRCDEITVDGGLGRVLLDLTGAAPTHQHLALQLTVGDATLRIPRSTGVRLHLDRILTDFQPAGLARNGSVFESPGYDSAAHRLDVDVHANVGGLKVEWVE